MHFLYKVDLIISKMEVNYDLLSYCTYMPVYLFNACLVIGWISIFWGSGLEAFVLQKENCFKHDHTVLSFI